MFHQKRVLVTGGSGFLGSYLVPKLLALGADVRVLDDMRRGRTWYEGASVIRIDAGNARAMESYMADADMVFNLAAHVAGVLYNQGNHLEMYEQNHRVQTAPIVASEKGHVSHFLQVSSVCIYAPAFLNPSIEAYGVLGEPARANNGYSWSKRMGEKALSYSSIPHKVIVRPSNLYGPRDYFDERSHVIPALIRKCIENDQIHVNGTGKEVREFLYADDCADGILAAMQKGANGEAYNLGTNGETSVNMKDLVALIQQATDTTHKSVSFSVDADPGDDVRWSDCEKAKTDLGWEWRTSLTDGIRATVEWYRGQL